MVKFVDQDTMADIVKYFERKFPKVGLREVERRRGLAYGTLDKIKNKELICNEGTANRICKALEHEEKYQWSL